MIQGDMERNDKSRGGGMIMLQELAANSGRGGVITQPVPDDISVLKLAEGVGGWVRVLQWPVLL